MAPSDSKRVYAFVESTSSALYVSSDGGKTWEARDKSQWMVWRPFYFAHMTVDPTNPDRIFKGDGNLILSEDARQELQRRRRVPRHRTATCTTCGSTRRTRST